MNLTSHSTEPDRTSLLQEVTRLLDAIPLDAWNIQDSAGPFLSLGVEAKLYITPSNSKKYCIEGNKNNNYESSDPFTDEPNFIVKHNLRKIEPEVLLDIGVALHDKYPCFQTAIGESSFYMQGPDVDQLYQELRSKLTLVIDVEVERNISLDTATFSGPNNNS